MRILILTKEELKKLDNADPLLAHFLAIKINENKYTIVKNRYGNHGFEVDKKGLINIIEHELLKYI